MSGSTNSHRPYVIIPHVPVPSRVRSLELCENRLYGLGLFTVEEDPVMNGAWWAIRDGILEAPPGVTHICVLADDSLPCLGFAKHLTAVIAARPNDAISLYPRNPAALDALKHGMSWYSSLNGAVQITCPIEMARDLVHFADTYLEADGLAEDELFGMYCMANGIVQNTTAIALVDHQGTKSLSGNDTHPYRRPIVRPYEDMNGINWNTDAIFVGREINTHWTLNMLNAAGREKYKTHERVFELDRHKHVGTVKQARRVVSGR